MSPLNFTDIRGRQSFTMRVRDVASLRASAVGIVGSKTQKELKRVALAAYFFEVKSRLEVVVNVGSWLFVI